MQISVDLDPAGLGEALAEVLPLGIRPLALQLTGERLRLHAKAPMLGEVVLVAAVELGAGEMILSRFDLEGAGLAKAFALGKLREAVSDLDRMAGPFHAWGEVDGDRLRVRWTAAQG